MKQNFKKRDWKKIVGILLFLSLLVSIIFITFKIIKTPSFTSAEAYSKV
ncbi:MAG: hypothetical protein K0R07_697, partial [Sedimentibacter sp.]|nr:hypothetical protein [Sedimentibacter sp.]